MTSESALRNRRAMTDLPERLSLEESYQEYAPQGLRYAFSMLRNVADAEEVVQEAFVRILRNFEVSESSEVDSLKLEAGRFAGLFFTTIRNLCIDSIRKQQRQSTTGLDASLEPVAKPTTTGQGDLEAKLTRALKAMPDLWAEALQLKVNGGLSYDEIARVMNASHAQVRSWIYRARRFLEKELAKAEVETS